VRVDQQLRQAGQLRGAVPAVRAVHQHRQPQLLHIVCNRQRCSAHTRQPVPLRKGASVRTRGQQQANVLEPLGRMQRQQPLPIRRVRRLADLSIASRLACIHNTGLCAPSFFLAPTHVAQAIERRPHFVDVGDVEKGHRAVLVPSRHGRLFRAVATQSVPLPRRHTKPPVSLRWCLGAVHVSHVAVRRRRRRYLGGEPRASVKDDEAGVLGRTHPNRFDQGLTSTRTSAAPNTHFHPRHSGRMGKPGRPWTGRPPCRRWAGTSVRARCLRGGAATPPLGSAASSESPPHPAAAHPSTTNGPCA
jgi:hypothetical protein